MIDTVKQACQDYYNELPDHSLRSVGLSALFTFTAGTLIAAMAAGNNQPVNFSRVVLATTVSLVASTIHALTAPLFNYLFNNTSHDYNGIQEFIHFVTDMTLTHLLLNHATSIKVNLITASNMQGDNFIILPHNLFKSCIDIVVRELDLFQVINRQQLYQVIQQQLGFNMHANSNVVYLTL